MLPLLWVLGGCSKRIELPLFNYLACRQSMTLKLEREGVAPVAANMQAMAYCREQQLKARQGE
jgi:hypothetical protein